MKKIMLTLSVMIFAVALMAGPGFAATIAASDTSGTISSSGNPTCVLQLSKNVSFVYSPDSTAAASAQFYAIGSRHASGDKAYGTASDTTLIYWITMTTGDISTTEIDDSDSDFKDSGGWTAM